jgi:hypothetical protein
VDATHFRFGLKRRRRKKRKERRERETKEEEEEEEAISDSWVTTCFVWLPRGSGRECFWHCAIGGGGGGGGGNKKLACNSSSSSSKPITDKCYTRDHPTRHTAKKRREKLLDLSGLETVLRFLILLIARLITGSGEEEEEEDLLLLLLLSSSGFAHHQQQQQSNSDRDVDSFPTLDS